MLQIAGGYDVIAKAVFFFLGLFVADDALHPCSNFTAVPPPAPVDFLFFFFLDPVGVSATGDSVDCTRVSPEVAAGFVLLPWTGVAGGASLSLLWWLANGRVRVYSGVGRSGRG